MSDVVISVENISKRYLVGHQSAQREGYTALRDVIGREVRNFARKTVDVVRGRQIVQGDEVEEFWALKDVSFEVRQGEVLGIIGRNGAGKSTLLKILSRITEPDRGRAILRGRVASLLEVGTGFHPELTGRENILLNGAILGMTRAEIKAKFDEIVAFAAVEQFLDTPVKRYSSGMYVRLAFAVAAHLEPEILIVDEVLAVGDAEFQKKCFGKMKDVSSKQGRTILFVSHSMAAVEGLCGSAILLAHGRNIAYGRASDVVHEYLQDISRVSVIAIAERTDRDGSGAARVVSMSLEGPTGQRVSVLRCGEGGSLHFVVENQAGRELRNLRMAVRIDSALGQQLTLLDTWLLGSDISRLPLGRTSVRFVMPRVNLMPGQYLLTIWMTINGNVADWIKDVAGLDVEAGNYFQSGRIPPRETGAFLSDHRFVVGNEMCVEKAPQASQDC